MGDSRIEGLLAMREKKPDDSRVLFALALEYEKLERWADAVETLREYLAIADDEGNAWGRLGNALACLDRTDEAKAAYARGVETANRHGHPSMAIEFEEALQELD